MPDIPLKLVRRPVRLAPHRDPLEWHKKPGYRSRPRISHDSEFKQLGKNFRWNCISIILQTEMFVARVWTLDTKSVDSVLEIAACEAIFTIARKNALNRIPPSS